MSPGSVSGRLFPSQRDLLSLTSHCADSRDECCIGSVYQQTYYVVEMCSSSTLLQGDSTHRYTHYCLLSHPFHDSKTHLMTLQVTVHQEMEIYEPLILMPYVLVFPWQPKGQIYPHKQVCTCVCMHMCVYVCMMRGIRGNIELRRLHLFCAGLCL